MTTITALPTPPSRADSTNFSTRGDAFLGALPTFVTEANAVGSEAAAAAAAAAASASAAAASQSTASTAAAAVAAQSPVANAAAAAASAAAAAASAAAAAQTSGAVAATTLSASGAVSGAGFTTYLASPPAIGGTAAAAVSATALSYTTTLTGGTGIVNLGSGQFYKDASGNVGIGTTAVRSATLVNALNGYTASNNGAVTPYFQWYNSNAGTDLKTWRVGGQSSGSLQFETVNDAYSAATSRLTFDSSGNIMVTSAALLGYGTGSGGTATQATSKSTAVTLNKPTGQITMNNAALAAGATVTFDVSNSLLVANDTIAFGLPYGAVDPSNYRVELAYTSNGLFAIRVTNITAGSRSEALLIRFAVIKGSLT